jgi:hypothetical protein
MSAPEALIDAVDIGLAVPGVDLAGENVCPVAELLRQQDMPFAFHTAHGSRLFAVFRATATFIGPMPPETLIGHLLKIAR